MDDYKRAAEIQCHYAHASTIIIFLFKFVHYKLRFASKHPVKFILVGHIARARSHVNMINVNISNKIKEDINVNVMRLFKKRGAKN